MVKATDKTSARRAAQPPAAKAAGVEAKGDQKVTHLQVAALKASGFWRAGRRWSAEPVTVPVGELSPFQIEQLLAEPMLAVVPLAEPASK